MNTKKFLERVFAQRDELVVCTHKPDPAGQNPRGIFWNRGSFADLDAAVAAITRWDAEPETTVYFGVGAFAGHEYVVDGKTKWQRKQAQATWFKALALDLDIGSDKPYATQKEGWRALHAAVQALGLPVPMVISSGRGIHCYWPLTEPVQRDEWVRVSTALRLALADNKVEIDTTKIHDPSMVLRPVGTHHKKQTPWKDVACVSDCGDFDLATLVGALQSWLDKVVAAPAKRASSGKGSSIADAVLNSNDVILDAVASRCGQVGALVASGGVTDAAGRPVQEPLWRASLGLAKHCTDVPEAVIKIAGKHPDFDLQDSLNKLGGWKGTGPTTCAKFEQLCPQGCEGCKYKGSVTSPAQLSATTEDTVETQDGTAVEVQLPPKYAERDGKIWMEKEVESTGKDANGNEVTERAVTWDLVSPYPMHITGVYKDPESTRSTFRLAVRYPMTGWQEEDHDIGVIATTGKDFSAFMLHRQVFGVKSPAQQEKLRGFLMDYLTMVQSAAPTGIDYVAFGWQPDGSFLCGENVIGSPTGHTDRRLRGPAARFGSMIAPHGDRAEWVRAMDMLNQPGSQTIRSAVLIATAGILGPAAGNASMVLSIYSSETTTGKTLALIAANSLIGTPKELFLNKNDTANALFKIRGVLNNLPCTIDELTSADEQDVVDLAYDLSQGREKIAMTKDRDLRDPVRWDGPTLVTTNISLHQKFEAMQANNDPLKARTMELAHHDRTFITTDADGSSNGYKFFDIVAKNNGWAFPELVEAVLAMGGAEAVWTKGEQAFMRKFNFRFEPQERFYRTSIVAGWIMGNIGKRLGLFPFDVDATIQYLLDHVEQFRKSAEVHKQDVFDVIGQFLQEHNDQLIEVTELYGSDKEQVMAVTPLKAVARLKVVYDQNTPVMPGSMLAINYNALRKWLSRTKDGVDRLVRELAKEGALIAERDRITMFKGCHGRNPGQAHCVVVNLNHPRFVAALTSSTAKIPSPVALAVLRGGAA